LTKPYFIVRTFRFTFKNVFIDRFATRRLRDAALRLVSCDELASVL